MWRRYGWFLAAVIIAAPTTVWVASGPPDRDDPVAVVREYLAAIEARRVDAALALVSPTGHGVPLGEQATFLDPRAIADGWGLMSAREVSRDEYGHEATVRIELGGPDGSAEGTLVVSRHTGPWRLESPFVAVSFPASPLSFVQINDVAVPIDRRPDAVGQPLEFLLFPGMYTFYPDLPPEVSGAMAGPVLAVPRARHGRGSNQPDPHPIYVSELAATDLGTAAVREQVATFVDTCAEFATPAPHRCPFATDGYIDTPDGVRVTELADLQWSVRRYPLVSVAEHRDEDLPAGFLVVTETPGMVTLTGSGVDHEGNPGNFTVECGVELTDVTVTVGADGTVALFTDWLPELDNTCYRSP